MENHKWQKWHYYGFFPLDLQTKVYLLNVFFIWNCRFFSESVPTAKHIHTLNIFNNESKTSKKGAKIYKFRQKTMCYLLYSHWTEECVCACILVTILRIFSFVLIRFYCWCLLLFSKNNTNHFHERVWNIWRSTVCLASKRYFIALGNHNSVILLRKNQKK